LRQAALALLAVPITLAALVVVFLRRSATARIGTAISLTVILGLGAFAVARPPTTVATPPQPIVPLTQAAFETIVATGHGLKEAVTIRFTTPMDAASVAAALTVEPATAVDLTWAPDATNLTISPRARWAPGVLQTVTVQAGALARTGQPLARPARAVFLTRGTTTGTVFPTETLGSRVALTTGFVVNFAGPVDAESVQTAIRLDPAVPGVVRQSSPTEAKARFTFQPTKPLRSDIDYRLIVAGVRDADGVPLDTIEMTVRTIVTPGVVRFRPRADSTNVSRASDLSVRFTQAMDRRSSARALSVTVAGKTIKGKTHWAEQDKVLVFTPSAALPAGKTVLMTVSTVATNVAGVHLAEAAKAAFKTAKASVVTTSGETSTGSRPVTGGSAVGGGSWAAVETYYLGLMNCTRTGGWVTSTGRCSSPGGRNVAPLKLSAGISSNVARPYARRLAVGADCSHFIGGSPYDRLRRAGYTNQTWAENIGCRSGNARAAVLATHLFYQSEKSYAGGHYVNLMNPKYDRVGIGVWVSGGRVRLVIDFYHP
jgi:uncharacterized protein YkwD